MNQASFFYPARHESLTLSRNYLTSLYVQLILLSISLFSTSSFSHLCLSLRRPLPEFWLSSSPLASFDTFTSWIWVCRIIILYIILLCPFQNSWLKLDNFEQLLSHQKKYLVHNLDFSEDHYVEEKGGGGASLPLILTKDWRHLPPLCKPAQIGQVQVWTLYSEIVVGVIFIWWYYE